MGVAWRGALLSQAGRGNPWVYGSGSRVYGLRFRMWSVRFRAQGLWCKVKGCIFRV
jgi:hypothetical protein